MCGLAVDVSRGKERRYSTLESAPWQCLYFLPEPQGQGSLRPTLRSPRTKVPELSGGGSGGAPAGAGRRSGTPPAGARTGGGGGGSSAPASAEAASACCA